MKAKETLDKIYPQVTKRKFEVLRMQQRLNILDKNQSILEDDLK